MSKKTGWIFYTTFNYNGRETTKLVKIKYIIDPSDKWGTVIELKSLNGIPVKKPFTSELQAQKANVKMLERAAIKQQKLIAKENYILDSIINRLSAAKKKVLNLTSKYISKYNTTVL